MKTLTEEMFDHIAACFTGIWIESFEHADAVTEINQLCRDNEWDLQIWDVCNGIHLHDDTAEGSETTDPLSALKAFAQSSADTQPSLLILKNFHRFLGNAEIAQTVAELIHAESKPGISSWR